MGNTKTLSDVIYYEEFKNEFLAQYSDDTNGSRKIYKRIFQKSYKHELSKGKDLYDFTEKEIMDLLFDLNPVTKSSSRSNGRIITAYLNWAGRIGDRANTNTLVAKKPDWFDRFVSKRKLYISLKELKDITNPLANAQDSVLPLLLFFSVQGKEISEILNLKEQDIDIDNNTLILRADRKIGNKTFEAKGFRELEVPRECMVEVKNALAQKIYEKKNGMANITARQSTTTDLVNNDYLIRASITNTKTRNDRADKHMVYRRIKMISEIEGLPFLTTKNIVKSGQIYMGYKLLKRHGELGMVQLKEIAKEFNVSWYPLKDYVTIENIKELYPENLQ